MDVVNGAMPGTVDKKYNCLFCGHCEDSFRMVESYSQSFPMESIDSLLYLARVRMLGEMSGCKEHEGSAIPRWPYMHPFLV